MSGMMGHPTEAVRLRRYTRGRNHLPDDESQSAAACRSAAAGPLAGRRSNRRFRGCPGEAAGCCCWPRRHSATAGSLAGLSARRSSFCPAKIAEYRQRPDCGGAATGPLAGHGSRPDESAGRCLWPDCRGAPAGSLARSRLWGDAGQAQFRPRGIGSAGSAPRCDSCRAMAGAAICRFCAASPPARPGEGARGRHARNRGSGLPSRPQEG